MIYENIKFANNYTVTYKDFSDIKKKGKVTEKSKANLLQNDKKKKKNGYMSRATASKCKEHINVLILALKHGSKGKRQATFVTLTLPCKQLHDDNFIKREMLNHFLITAKRKYDVKNLFWRAEAQKNDNIHFHILFDNFVEWNMIRGHWNAILHKYGYIDLYRNNQKNFHKLGFTVREELLPKWSKEKQEKAYKYGVKSNWNNPNTTDIHGLYKVKNIASYICKYMTKSDETARSISGRIWGATTELKKYKYFNTELAAHDFDISAYNSDVTRYLTKLDNDVSIRKKGDDFFQLYLHQETTEKLLKKHSKVLYKQYKEHYKYIYNQLY